MDTITHTVLGACLGEVIAGKQLGKKAMLIGALVNNFPDVDVLASFFNDPAANLLVHRGITHSILVCTLLTFLFAWLLKTRYRDREVSWRRWLILVGSGFFLHIGLDACTSYGTGWFEPFSHARVSFNTLFILDPIFLLPLLVAAVILLILKRNSARRLKISKLALTLSFLYLALTILIKLYVTAKIEKNIQAQQISYSDYMVTPTPLNNLLWYVLTKDSTGSSVSYYSLLDKNHTLTFQHILKRDSLLAPYKSAREVQQLIRFSKDYYSVTKTDSSLLFSDLRFGQIGGWYDPNAPFVFNFDIISRNNLAHIQQGRMKSFGTKPLKELLKRIKGKP